MQHCAQGAQQKPVSWGVFHLAKISVQPVEMKMERAEQTEIFRKKMDDLRR